MIGFKGFDKDLKCRGFQYEVGKEFVHDGPVEACSSGFHFCENPMDVFNYYPPSDNRYCEVKGDGDIDKERDGDSKVAVSKIHISAEIGIKGIIEAGVKFILDKVNWKDAKESNNEYKSAATNTGYKSAATVEGKESVACALGIESKAKGALGCWLVIAEWYQDENFEWHRKDVKSVSVDGEIIKADTWYTLKNGDFVEITE